MVYSQSYLHDIERHYKDEGYDERITVVSIKLSAMIEKNVIDYVYVIMIAIQVLCWLRIIREAIACKWNRPSKWIATRLSVVYAGVYILTMLGWIMADGDDWLLQGAFIVGLFSMTMLCLLYLPDIIDGMNDPQVADDLNIRSEKTDIDDGV